MSRGDWEEEGSGCQRMEDAPSEVVFSPGGTRVGVFPFSVYPFPSALSSVFLLLCEHEKNLLVSLDKQEKK